MSYPASNTPAGPSPEGEAVLCAKHQVLLEPGKVDLTYQGHTFPVDILRCPVCGLTLIPEELARGSMLEVEQTLEEK
jgi:hypothetical protein